MTLTPEPRHASEGADVVDGAEQSYFFFPENDPDPEDSDDTEMEQLETRLVLIVSSENLDRLYLTLGI